MSPNDPVAPTPAAEAAPSQCQVATIQQMGDDVDEEQGSLGRRLRLFIRSLVGPARVRKIKTRLNDWANRLGGKANPAPVVPAASTLPKLEAGDWVRVKSLEEIMTTLNMWRQLRGCAFMAEMEPYCGTVQRVLKPVRRFVDERDLRVVRSNGIVLLEGLVCQGTAGIGPCDRSCLYFWRVEWLEKIPPPETAL